MPKIIDIRKSLKLKPVKHRTACRCESVLVIEKTRSIECAKCGRIMDPFDYLLTQAERQQNISYGIDYKKNESLRLEEEIQELKKVRSNLKAQIKRAKTKIKG